MGIFDRFINGSESDAVGFKIADATDPVKWGKLATAIGGSIIAGAASAAMELPFGIATAFQNLYGGAADGVETLVEAVFEPFATVPLGLPVGGGNVDPLSDSALDKALDQIWAIAYIDAFGLFAGPVAVAFVLVSAGIVVIGAQQAIETFRSGGGIL